jgi:hypothetical protein
MGENKVSAVPLQKSLEKQLELKKLGKFMKQLWKLKILRKNILLFWI